MEHFIAVGSFLLALLTSQVSFAQDANDADLSTYGHEFFLGFYEHVHTADTHIFYVLTQETSAVTFTVTSIDVNQFSYTGITSRNSPAAVAIPFSYEIRGETYEWRDKGLRVSTLSKDLITVVVWSYRSSADYMAFLAQPCHEQPTETYIYYAVSTLGWSDQKSMFLIVTCMDDTHISIIPNNLVSLPADAQDPNSPLVDAAAGVMHNVTMHSLQTLLVYQPYVDLSGSKIISDKPLTLVSGHEASRVPAGTFDADPIVTQVPPTITWGTSFLLHPQIGRTNGQNYKVIAHTPTLVTLSCTGGTPDTTFTLNANDVHDFFTTANEYCSLVSTEPLYVSQVGVSTNYNGNYGDNTLNTVPPVDQYINTVQYRAFPEAVSYYSVLMTPEYYNTQLVINEVNLNLTWTPITFSNGSIAGYGYSTGTSGTHILAHPHSKGGIFVGVYGWTTYGGYSYNGGMNLNPINPTYLPPEVSFSQLLFSGNESDETITISLKRINEFETNISVLVSVSPTPEDSAMDIADYTTFTEVVNFTITDMMQNVTIDITDDDVAEATEYFTVAVEAISEHVVIFPYASTTVEILDDDSITLGFTSDQFYIDDWDETNMTVAIQNGSLQDDATIRMMMQVGLPGENISSVAFDLSNFHNWVSFRGILSLFSTYNRNLTQMLWCTTWVEETSVMTIVDIPWAVIVPPPPPPSPTPSSTSMPPTTTDITSTMPMVVTTTEDTGDVSVSISISTVISTITFCETSTVKITNEPVVDDSTSGFNKQIAVSSGGLYLGIFFLILVMAIELVVSFICCIGCYYRGQKTGQKLPFESHGDVTISAQNALYDSVVYDGDTASISTGDHKALIQSMEYEKENMLYSKID